MGNKKDVNINIGVISDIVFEPYFAPLLKSRFGENVIIYPIPYEERSTEEYKEKLAKSDMIVVWLNFESLFPDVWTTVYSYVAMKQKVVDEIAALCEKLLSDLSEYSNVPILWFSFEEYCTQLPMITGHNHNVLVDSLNLKLCDTLSSNVSFIDLKHLIAEVGIANAYDPKSKYRWNAPYSKALVETTVKEIHKQYMIEKGITKKCLILDCDNVLWGGILSEDGVENIKLGGSGLGRAYQDFQRFLLTLYYHGIILAVCSKNDLSDVMTMFNDHSEMILKEEHIAYFEVNWGNKPDNIRNIAETLNIGFDSMVFVDDSPIEIEAVKSMLPEVTAILYDRDTVYGQLSCFNLKNNVNIADVENRNETYRTNQSRENLKSQYGSYSGYIDALEIKMNIHETLPIEFNRISELTQRTNKCTNGRRYTVAEIKKRVNNNIALYSLYVSDRFADLGLVGAFEVDGNTLTLFSLSCRALGREIEDKMLVFIKGKYEINKVEFHSTGKNEDIKSLLSNEFSNANLIYFESP